MYQTWVLPVWGKIFRNSDQISQSLNIGAAFFGRSIRLMTKIQPVKKVKKSQRIAEIILVPVSTLQAEALWTLKVASSHFSLRLCLGLNKLFRNIFTNNEIVKSVQLSKTKYGCSMNFGLVPHFKDLLLKVIKASDCFGVSCDE